MAVVHELGSPLLGFEKFSSNEVDLVSALCTGYDTAKIIFLGLDSHACIVPVRIQESLPLEEVFEQLNTSRGGLSSSNAAERLQLFGANRLQEKRVSSPFWIPIICILNSYYMFFRDPFSFYVCSMAGEQGPEIPQLHVEPVVLGDGGSSSHGIGLCEWRRKFSDVLKSGL